METIEILKNAKQILIDRGRTIGTLLHGDTGKVCPLGAIGFAMDPEFDLRVGYDAFWAGNPAHNAAKALAKVIPDDVFEAAFVSRSDEYEDVYNYNDVIVGSGKDNDQEILDLFDRAIASAAA